MHEEACRIATELLQARFEGRKIIFVTKQYGRLHITIKGNFAIITEDLTNGFNKILEMAFDCKVVLINMEVNGRRLNPITTFEYFIIKDRE